MSSEAGFENRRLLNIDLKQQKQLVVSVGFIYHAKKGVGIYKYNNNNQMDILRKIYNNNMPMTKYGSERPSCKLRKTVKTDWKKSKQ